MKKLWNDVGFSQEKVLLTQGTGLFLWAAHFFRGILSKCPRQIQFGSDEIWL
jgi:hypothetical protein